jgi:hypothetical protein
LTGTKHKSTGATLSDWPRATGRGALPARGSAWLSPEASESLRGQKEGSIQMEGRRVRVKGKLDRTHARFEPHSGGGDQYMKPGPYPLPLARLAGTRVFEPLCSGRSPALKHLCFRLRRNDLIPFHHLPVLYASN